MTSDTLLRGLERGLLTVGLALGVWCAAVLVEARFHNAVTTGGPLTVTQTAVPALAGDARDATGDRTYRYRISQTLIVGPDDVYVLDPTGRPTLTLVTCYPFNFVGHAPKRFIVRATLEGGDARNTQPGDGRTSTGSSRSR
jgi:hypothetical protein